MKALRIEEYGSVEVLEWKTRQSQRRARIRY